MSPSARLLSSSPTVAVRRVCLALLDDARSTLPRLDDPTDAEALHDFRVAIRRLRSTVRAWREQLGKSVSKRHRKKLKRLQNDTGGGRDSEVALEWIEAQVTDGLDDEHRLGVDWLRERLAERKRAAMSHVRSAIRTRFEKLEADLRPRLTRLTVTVDLEGTAAPRRFADELAEAARDHVEDLARTLVPITSIDQEEELHDLRIAGKRLRYLVEPAKEAHAEAKTVLKTCKKLQDLLGQLNDGFVLRAMLRGALEDASVERARMLHDLARQPEDAPVRKAMKKTERPGLLEITRRNEARIRKLYERIEREWIETAAAPLVHAVEAFARAARDNRVANDEEIERKYLLSHLPDLAGLDVTVHEIQQGYLPGDSIRERVRRILAADGSQRFVRTLKAGRGVRRIEVEEECDAATFEALWALTEGARVHKRRFAVRDGTRTWELDVFTDRDLFLAEIELGSEDEAVDVPAWLAPAIVREVTDENGFTNLELAS